MIDRAGKLMNLFRRLKIAIVGEGFVKFAFVGRVRATNLRARFIDTAPVIVLQVFAGRMDQQIPSATLYKNGCAFMQQIPPHEIEITFGMRRIDRQCEILAAFGCAMVAQILARFELAAIKLEIGFSVHR